MLRRALATTMALVCLAGGADISVHPRTDFAYTPKTKTEMADPIAAPVAEVKVVAVGDRMWVEVICGLEDNFLGSVVQIYRADGDSHFYVLDTVDLNAQFGFATFKDTDVEENKKYRYKMRAVSSTGTVSEFTEPLALTTVKAETPSERKARQLQREVQRLEAELSRAAGNPTSDVQGTLHHMRGVTRVLESQLAQANATLQANAKVDEPARSHTVVLAFVVGILSAAAVFQRRQATKRAIDVPTIKLDDEATALAAEAAAVAAVRQQRLTVALQEEFNQSCRPSSPISKPRSAPIKSRRLCAASLSSVLATIGPALLSPKNKSDVEPKLAVCSSTVAVHNPTLLKKSTSLPLKDASLSQRFTFDQPAAAVY